MPILPNAKGSSIKSVVIVGSHSSELLYGVQIGSLLSILPDAKEKPLTMIMIVDIDLLYAAHISLCQARPEVNGNDAATIGPPDHI